MVKSLAPIDHATLYSYTAIIRTDDRSNTKLPVLRDNLKDTCNKRPFKRSPVIRDHLKDHLY